MDLEGIEIMAVFLSILGLLVCCVGGYKLSAYKKEWGGDRYLGDLLFYVLLSCGMIFGGLLVV